MDIPTQSWIPGTKRNRWAWGLAWGNLAVLLLWNFLPFYELTHNTVEDEGIWVAEHMVMIEIWPSVFEGLYLLVGRSMDFEDYVNMIATMALIFMVAVQFLLVPMWRMFSSSRLLRFIPAGLCSLGFCTLVYVLISEPYSYSEMFSIIILSIIALNFFLSVLVLLLYHPEPVPDYET